LDSIEGLQKNRAWAKADLNKIDPGAD